MSCVEGGKQESLTSMAVNRFCFQLGVFKETVSCWLNTIKQGIVILLRMTIKFQQLSIHIRQTWLSQKKKRGLVGSNPGCQNESRSIPKMNAERLSIAQICT